MLVTMLITTALKDGYTSYHTWGILWTLLERTFSWEGGYVKERILPWFWISFCDWKQIEKRVISVYQSKSFRDDYVASCWLLYNSRPIRNNTFFLGVWTQTTFLYNKCARFSFSRHKVIIYPHICLSPIVKNKFLTHSHDATTERALTYLRLYTSQSSSSSLAAMTSVVDLHSDYTR